MKILNFLFLTVLFAGACWGSEIAMYPEKPKGGEGYFIFAKGSPMEYSVVRNERQFFFYDIEDGISGTFLPVWIEEKNTEKISLFKRVPEGIQAESEITIEIEERPIETIRLRARDEKMRSAQPMIDAQNWLVSRKLHYVSREKLWVGEFIAPLKNRVSSPFALKREGKKFNYFHRGIDYSAQKGTPVKAVNRGRVILSAKNLNVYGNTLIIDHGQGIISCYFHMNKLYKNEGEIVHKGEYIGQVGGTGWATGPHLHFGIYLQGIPVDPLWWIAFSGNITKRNITSKLFSAKETLAKN
ncbi:MAG: M23 family metallopeptidase [Elusimicrobia bacterium]|nr:M23 family metallopeptidase [Elusimicrobiota bacterium]